MVSLDLSIIDDQDKECDEKFTAEIILGGSSEGFGLGPTATSSITVQDNEGGVGYTFLHCSDMQH